jgi:hypothetical protein
VVTNIAANTRTKSMRFIGAPPFLLVTPGGLLFRNNSPKCCGAPQQLLYSGEGISMEAQKEPEAFYAPSSP